MWLASFILLPVGIMLTYMATSDSVIMNTETYTNFFRKIINKLTALINPGSG
jgi:lipopolysaccharide export system permease protein